MADKPERKRRKYVREELETIESVVDLNGGEADFIKAYVAHFGEVRTYQSLVDAWRNRDKLLKRLEGLRTVVKAKSPRKVKTADEVLTHLADALDRNTEMLGDLYKAHRETQRLLKRVLGVTKDEQGGGKG